MTHHRRKIAVVIPKYGLIGGGERFASELTERIANDPRNEVHVFANLWQPASDNVMFHFVPMIGFPKFLTTPGFAFFANRQISAMNFDIVHSHERIFVADIVTLHGVPHRFWVKEIRKKKMMSLFDLATAWVEKRMANHPKCRFFLPVSGMAKEKFLQEYPSCPAKIRVICPGTDTVKFRPPDEKSRLSVRQSFGFRDSDTVIIFVGMNFEVKGLDKLMAAAAIAKSRNPSAGLKLLIVGKGNLKKYEALAKKSGLGNDTIFAGVMSEGIETMYGAADVFSMLSEFDAFGMAVSEAMSCGLPVIVSHNVGAKDMVCDGVNGFVENSEDTEAVASKLLILTDVRQRLKMAAAARETALAHTWDAIAEQVSKLYEEIKPL